ncbi:MAG: PAS domain-containing protein, partial [Victivallaceae bacterium]
MENDGNRSGQAAKLRKHAEKIIQKKSVQLQEPASPEEIRQMLHELRVHQIELEMQNEELRRTQLELAASRAHYFDFYNLAPVGYCTISEQGLILEANLYAATLLGVVPDALSRHPVSRFIHKEDQDIYYLFRKKLVKNGEPQTCELRMVKENGTSFRAHLTATGAQDVNDNLVCRIVFSD